MRRKHKFIATALLALNFSGARVVMVDDPCGQCRVCYSATLGFKAILKAATRQEWRRSAPRAFGMAHNHYTAWDLDSNRRTRRVSPAVVPPTRTIALEPRQLALDFADARKLPSDISPVQPAHLETKK